MSKPILTDNNRYKQHKQILTNILYSLKMYQLISVNSVKPIVWNTERFNRNIYVMLKFTKRSKHRDDLKKTVLSLKEKSSFSDDFALI